MSPPIKAKRVAETLLSSLGLQLVSCTVLQTLWAGYGHICAITARAASDQVNPNLNGASGKLKVGPNATYHLILKLISPPKSDGDEGHLRKLLSYEVEQYFYQEVTPHLDQDVAVARCLASTGHLQQSDNPELQGLTATLMEDLRPRFPVAGEKRSILSQRQVHAALEWLAKFHAGTWKLLPDDLNRYLLPPLKEMKRRQVDGSSGGDKLWLNGGYTYLATRRTELASLADDTYSEWCSAFCEPMEGSTLSVAERVASFLTPRGRPFESYIHGDVKSENLFTTDSGDQVAFFDFQYVGLGFGVCDLAKLFTCSVPLQMLTEDYDVPDELPMDKGEKDLLERYRKVLVEHRPPHMKDFDYPMEVLIRHWETALVDWCRFQASWGFWGNTEWLEARVRSILKDQTWVEWLKSETC
ncbi:Ecdysteroid kinase-domain-containing protein [Thelonectria olida]|uniref:Ecdysteroid kinase-domain-containing protein n=1 Tax=Thelonectria olida TaxID=1576542 RepID=A0A9P9AUB8_9HYPO|nr:Ecdysteroid kinase-domain-containing protein [Thelonectria olida]